MRKIGLVQSGLLLLACCSGCMTGPTFFERQDKYSNHEPGTDAWWAEKATLPPGVRQKYKKGKMWPPQPRSHQEPQQFSHTYYSAHYWPHPYSCQDRHMVHGVIEQQVALGWQEETTLYSRHFDPVTQELNRAGSLHLEYLLHAVPPERRAVYVQSTLDVSRDATRVASVEAIVAQTAAGREGLTVQLRECLEYSRPAAEVDRINARYLSTMPSPRLAGSSGASSGSAQSATAGNTASTGPSIR